MLSSQSVTSWLSQNYITCQSYLSDSGTLLCCTINRTCKQVVIQIHQHAHTPSSFSQAHSLLLVHYQRLSLDKIMLFHTRQWSLQWVIMVRYHLGYMYVKSVNSDWVIVKRCRVLLDVRNEFFQRPLVFSFEQQLKPSNNDTTRNDTTQQLYIQYCSWVSWQNG